MAAGSPEQQDHSSTGTKPPKPGLHDQYGNQLFTGPGTGYTQWGQTIDPSTAWQAAVAQYGPEGLYTASTGQIVRNIGTADDPYYINVGTLPHANRPTGFSDWLLDNLPLLAGGAAIGVGALSAAGYGGAAGAGAAGGSGAATGGAALPAATTGIDAATAAALPGAAAVPTAAGTVGATTGIGASTAAALPGGASAGAGAGAAGATTAALPASTISPVGGLATGTTSSLGSGMSFWGSLGNYAADYFKDPSNYVDLARSLTSASNAAGNNRLTGDQIQTQRDRLALEGQNSYEQQLLARAVLEARQRSQAQRDLARNNFLLNAGRPTNLPPISPAYAATLQSQMPQLTADATRPPQYNTNQLPALQQFKPTPATQPGFFERAGSGIGTGLGIAGAVLGGYGK